jgi:hypothetical protein
MKDSILLHDNTNPQTSLHTCEAMAKMASTDLSHPAHSPDLAPPTYYLFGPVKDALCGCHLANDKKVKQSFSDTLQSQGREFTTMVHSFLLNAERSVFK